MCGIVGIASSSPVRDHDLLLIQRDLLEHRGPDEAGVWWSEDGTVGLGHRRLSIIDLSPGGHQPMSACEGNIQIIYNGEIYNYRELRSELEGCGYRFQTRSDTEVILAAYQTWGVECVARLNGMFALAIYDRTKHRVFIARDRAGEKPLFYCHSRGKLMFASELKALLADPACPRELDLDALNMYLAYGYVPDRGCILHGIRKLPQGHALTYDVPADQLSTCQYWQLPVPPRSEVVDPDGLLDELDSLLEDAVRLRLVADVPVGVLLSGGLDSSLVTAMAARASAQPVKTFTVSFPDDPEFDEGPSARKVARHFGTDHEELVGRDTSLDLMSVLARQYDEPIGDHSIIPTFLVSRLTRQHVKVALGGDGGDELFGGYPHYNFVQRIDGVRRFVPPVLRRLIGGLAAAFLPVGTRGRNHLLGFSGDLPFSLAHVNLLFDHASRTKLLVPQAQQRYAQTVPERHKMSLCNGGFSPLQMATRLDFRTTLVDDYLVKVDRASMLTSLEMRAPLLDHRLIEFAFGRIPDELRATTSQRKVLLRRLAERLLPRDLDIRRKQGLSLPLARWFRRGWGDYVEGVLMETDPQLFSRAMIRGLLKGQKRGYSNANRLFALTMFELWRREYRVSAPATRVLPQLQS
jgi:asparagine synthase (glutamine-hydrolysing)